MDMIEEYISRDFNSERCSLLARDWQLGNSEFPLRILNPNGAGTINADTWWKMAFGAKSSAEEHSSWPQ